MKKGNQVTIRDGSYMLTTNEEGNLTHYGNGNTHIIGLCRDQFTVVFVGKEVFPSEESLAGKNRENNTIIQHNETKEIWFCHDGINLTEFEEEVPELTMEEAIDKMGFEFKLKK